MDYSKNLRQIAKKIADFIKKNKVTGVVLLHEPGYGEFLWETDSSNLLGVGPEGEVFIDADINKLQQNEILNNTVNAISVISDMTLYVGASLEILLDQIKKKYRIVEGDPIISLVKVKKLFAVGPGVINGNITGASQFHLVIAETAKRACELTGSSPAIEIPFDKEFVIYSPDNKPFDN